MAPSRLVWPVVLLLAVTCVLGLAARPHFAALPVIPVPDLSAAVALTVHKVVDGDTLVVLDGAVETTIRLVGVDTPELRDGREGVKAVALGAARFADNLLKGEGVYLVDFEGTRKTDRYGRRLCYVYRAPDGLFVNAELLRQGYATVYDQVPFAYLKEFRELERFARGAGKGLWDGMGPESAAVGDDGPGAAAVTVYVTRTGSKYHRAGCRHLKSSIEMDLKTAKGRYGPCSVCRPAK